MKFKILIVVNIILSIAVSALGIMYTHAREQATAVVDVSKCEIIELPHNGAGI